MTRPSGSNDPDEVHSGTDTGRQTGPAQDRRVLIVEDHVHTRFLLCEYLREFGVLHDEVCTPQEAISRVVEAPERYALILLDIHYPGHVSALDLLADMRADIGALTLPKMIAITGDKALFDAEAVLPFDIVDVIPKPIYKHLLFNVIAPYLELA